MNVEQTEEEEVLKSIYDGDKNFVQINPSCYHYKFHHNQTSLPIVLEINWGEKYPHEKPGISLHGICNSHLDENYKKNVLNAVDKQIEIMVGSAMTYNIIEWLKENLPSLLENCYKDNNEEESEMSKSATLNCISNSVSCNKEKKEFLSKLQKKKLYDRIGNIKELPRGWNWIDIIKHLSQAPHH